MKSNKLQINIREILFLTGAVLAYRLLYVQFIILFQNSNPADPNFEFSNLILDTLGNAPITLLMVLCNFWFAKFMNKRISYGKFFVLRFSFELIYLILFSIIIAMIISAGDIGRIGLKSLVNSGLLGLTFLSVLLVNTVVLYTINVIQYYRNAHREALRFEREEKQKAQFNYSQLKRQLDPHFLFNSLNVLDNLVHTNPSRASEFISKLAKIYRYMLSAEENDTVPLADEMRFVEGYVELMRDRFEEGIVFKSEVDEKLMTRSVVPCSVQTLVENAIKHNVVSPEKPLTITVGTIGNDTIFVRNNLQPKQTPVVSNKVGLQNINAQCEMILGRSANVIKTSDKFEVMLPIK